jgi:perosamine synthetase
MPVFADVEANTLLLDPKDVEGKITPHTKAIVAVDYAGQPCDYDILHNLAARHGLALVADACHAPGGSYKGRPVGSLAHVNTFSLHPVKHITTGEGGMITTDDGNLAQRMRFFRNHGINLDCRQREGQGSWFYEMVDLGYNYRLTDFQCALGISQLKKLPAWITRRREIAGRYDQALANLKMVQPLQVAEHVGHAYHLYVVRLQTQLIPGGQRAIFKGLRDRGIGVNVHYIPVHLHPFYREHFGTGPGQCPVAEAAYEQIISLPIFPQLSEDDLQYVLDTCRQMFQPEAR